MPVERRGNQRKAITQDVVLCCGHLGLVRGRASNISTGGMFVHTGRVRLDVNSRIEVCYGTSARGKREFHRLLAKVVRIDKAGLGLMFLQCK